MLGTLTITQKRLILASMLKELEYLFCSDEITKRFTNEDGETVTISLEHGAFDDEDVYWEVYIEDTQVAIGVSQRQDFIEDFLKCNEDGCFF